MSLKTLKDIDVGKIITIGTLEDLSCHDIGIKIENKIKALAIKWVKYYMKQGKLLNNEMWFAKAEATMEQNNITPEDLQNANN